MINISVIMPLYNAEKYLKEALESILKQTYQEYEVICINDASTDSTISILRDFQVMDKRIKILENSQRLGAAFSRNRGIHEARGKYITFLDGDDIFDEEMFDLSYKEIEKQNADIVMYEYKHVPSEHIYEKQIIRRNNLFVEKYCKKPFSVRDFEPIEFMNWSAAPWNKLYRKSFVLTNKLEFQNLESSNDVYFVNMALLLASQLIMLDDRRVMVYARDHSTQTRISYNRDPMCVYQAIKKIGEALIERKLFEKLFEYYYFEVFYYLRGGILVDKNIERARKFYSFLQKEGINNIVGLCNKEYKMINKNIFNMLENYKNLDFDSKWYIDETILKYYLYKNKNEIISFFESCANHNKRIAIWGAGKNGKTLLNFIQINNIQVAEVIDKDVNKEGKFVNGYIIKTPHSQNVLEKVQVIIASSYLIYSEILEELKNCALEIINIEEIIKMP